MPGLLEVYPHPALVELMRTEKRLPCKQGETRDYWPMETPANRRTKLFETWRVIVAGLDQEVPGASEVLQLPPLEAPSWQLKAFEDMLDAVICAWGGICVFEGSAVQHGDDTSAIWIPGQSFWRRRGPAVIGFLRQWIEHRRAIRRRRKTPSGLLQLTRSTPTTRRSEEPPAAGRTVISENTGTGRQRSGPHRTACRNGL